MPPPDGYAPPPGEHPNAILLRDGYAAFAKGDLAYIRTLLAPEVVHRIPGRNPLCGDYRTHEEVLGFYVRLFELSGGTFRTEPYSIMATDDHGVALVNASAERPGKVLGCRAVDIFRFRLGKVIEIRSIPEDMYLDDAFWS